MAAHWTPTVNTYLGRVSKARILEAVRDVKGDASAQLIDHLKKPDMAREAERLLAGTGWLPSRCGHSRKIPQLLRTRVKRCRHSSMRRGRKIPAM